MPHSSHKLKAYTGDFNRPMVFCEACGKEEDEGLNDPCSDKFLEKDTEINTRIVDRARNID